MPEEPILREQARNAILNGKLPSHLPERTWGGPGVGVTCVICGEPVTKQQMAIEIQFSQDGGSPGLDKFDTHVRCFAAWEFERVRLGGERYLPSL
jgi:hypothetical protein